MAPDFIFVEADGKCQFPAAGSLHGHRFDHGFGGILWSFCPVMLGILVPRSSEDILGMLVPGSSEHVFMDYKRVLVRQIRSRTFGTFIA